MQPFIIGVDIGTGSTKAVALSTNGEVLTAAQQHYPTYAPQLGYSEQDPELVWQAFITCIQEIGLRTGASPVAIALSSAMHSLIMVDENCIALSPMLTWADTRNADIAEDLYYSEDAALLYKNTGTPVHAMSPLAKLIWLHQYEKEKYVHAHKFISIKEFIWFKLFRQFEVDYSIASATGLFNIQQLHWDEHALSLAHISAAQLSQPVNTDYFRKDVIPETCSMLKIQEGTAFYMGASDGCLANVGSFALEKGVAALTIGTSGAVRIACRRPVQNFGAMIFNYRLNEDLFISGGPISNGGSVVQWLLKNFLNKEVITEEDYKKLFDVISSVPAGSNGLLFLPYLTGERAPVWDAKSSGSFFGIRQQHTQAHFLRAAIEGVCFALNEVLLKLEKDATLSQINISGGFIHSKEWIQILADITGKKICLVQCEDASAVGAAYLALKQLQFIKEYEDLKPEHATIILPNDQLHKLYAQQFKIYEKLYGSLKEQMHELYRLSQ